MTARMARKYLSWRRLPWCWAFFRWRFTALRSEGDMVKRIQHIGPFLRNEMGVSLRGMSPMCDHSSIHLSENLFLKVYSVRVTTFQDHERSVQVERTREEGDKR